MAMQSGDLGKIRIASPADAPALASMHVASWRESYVGMVPDALLSELSVQGRAAMWDRIMREPTTPASPIVYLAEHNGELIGFGSCGGQRTGMLKDTGYEGEISAIYVLQAFQRHSVGTRLLFAMFLDLSIRGFSAASLWVLRDNAPARKFYERHGGHVIAKREDVRGEVVLAEVAYGWARLQELGHTARQ
jgi:ribosomal protein S18 acetylase RimI-like enzyme